MRAQRRRGRRSRRRRRAARRDGQRTEMFLALPSAQRASRKLALGARSARTAGAGSSAPCRPRRPPRRRASGRRSAQRRVRELADDRSTGSSSRAQRTRRPGFAPGHGSSMYRPGFAFSSACDGGQHHAFAEAELHLARREVGDHHGELADQVLGLVGRLDAAEDVARAAPRRRRASGAAACRALDRVGRRRSARCAGRPSRSRRSDRRRDRLAARRVGAPRVGRAGGSNSASSCFGSTRCIRCW